MTLKLKKIAETIQTGSKIAILPHTSPDGDCLGSSFALSLALKKLNKEPLVILEEDVPQLYSFLPGSDIKTMDVLSKGMFDMVICLDCGDERRLNNRIEIFNDCELTINIDHHISNTGFAQYNYIDTQSAATGEIIFDLLEELNVAIDKEMAENLYVAISTDTGGFKYSNTTSRTHIIVSALIQKNIGVAEINRRIYDTFSLDRLKLKAAAINLIEMHQHNKVAMIVLDYHLLQRMGMNMEDADGLSGIPRSIEDVEVGVVLTEKEPGQVKVSFRSNQYVDVSKIAVSFGGGGHQRASGCTLNMDMDEAVKKVLAAVKDEVTQGAVKS